MIDISRAIKARKKIDFKYNCNLLAFLWKKEKSYYEYDMVIFQSRLLATSDEIVKAMTGTILEHYYLLCK
jgi:hypothetical protein